LRRNLVEEYTPAMREATQSITTVAEALRLLTTEQSHVRDWRP
jgi:hypothetical protein